MNSFYALGICALPCPGVAFLCRLVLHHMMGEAALAAVNITWAVPKDTSCQMTLWGPATVISFLGTSLQNPGAAQKTFERQPAAQ